MTTTRPIPKRSWPTPADQAARAWHSKRGAPRLFFEPPAHGLTGDCEGLRQAAETAAFFVSPQNHLPLCFTVTVGSRVFATAALTIVAPITLLAVGREAVPNQFFTAAMAHLLIVALISSPSEP
jgi:hypothetical protein